MRIHNLDLNLVKAFVAVAEEGGFTRAAKKLFIEQPSVSRAIARLEKELQTRLFQRTKRRTTLTTKGEELLIVAKNILSSAGDLLDMARNKDRDLSGAIRFAAENPLSSIYFPEVIAKVSREHPNLWPMMFTGITDDAVDRIKRRELEFGVFLYEGVRRPGLEYRELAACAFKLVASRRISKSNLDSFIGSREINGGESAHLPTLESLKKLNKSIRIKYSANDIVAYHKMILKGLGIGLLPERMAREDLKRKTLKECEYGLKLDFPIWLVSRRGFPLSLEGKRIVELFLEVHGS